MKYLFVCLFAILNLVFAYGTVTNVQFTAPVADHEEKVKKLQGIVNAMNNELKFLCGHMECDVDRMEIILQTKIPKMVQLMKKEHESLLLESFKKFLQKLFMTFEKTSKDFKNNMRGNSQLLFMRYFAAIQKNLFDADAIAQEKCKHMEGKKSPEQEGTSKALPMTLAKNHEVTDAKAVSEVDVSNQAMSMEIADRLMNDGVIIQLFGACNNPERKEKGHSFRFNVTFDSCSFSASTQVNEVLSKGSKDENTPEGPNNRIPPQLLDQLKNLQSVFQPFLQDERFMGPLFGRISLFFDSDDETDLGLAKGESTEDEGADEMSGSKKYSELSNMYPEAKGQDMISLSEMFDSALAEVGTIIKSNENATPGKEGQGDIKVAAPLNVNSKEFKDLVGKIVDNITNDSEEGLQLTEEQKKKVEKVLTSNMDNFKSFEEVLKNELGLNIKDVINEDFIKNIEKKLKELESKESKMVDDGVDKEKKPVATYNLTIE